MIGIEYQHMFDRARDFAKGLAYWLASLAVLPALASFRIRAEVLGRDRAMEGSSQALSLVPGLLGHYLRRAFYSRTLTRCHRSVTIEFGVLLSKSGACLDENVYIGPRCHLGLVHLQRDVLLGPGVHVPSGRSTHGTGDMTRPIRDQDVRYQTMTIGAGSWIGSAAVVMADVGQDTVVGAGAVVVHPLPDRVVAVGNPARIVRSREPKDVTSHRTVDHG
jgi:virginiamycin A acetyltransferase